MIFLYGNGFSLDSIIHWILASAVWHIMEQLFRNQPFIAWSLVAVAVVISITLYIKRKNRKNNRTGSSQRSSNSNR